jgi:hypothetical protein
VLLIVLVLVLLTVERGGSSDERRQAVLALHPVGYWPADEGSGEVVHDLSSNTNHAGMVHVPWDGERNLLHFTGAYQWLEIPAHKAYQTPAFSMGGWVFLRSDVIGSGWVNKQGLLLIGNRHWLNQVGVQLCIRKQETIDVVMDGREDVLGTRLYATYKDGKRVEHAYGEPNLEIGQWHHLVYTFEPAAEQPAAPDAPNLSRHAAVTASNDGGHASRSPTNAVDGDLNTEWVCWDDTSSGTGERWIQLDFAQETDVNRVRLISRSGRSDFFRSGVLEFSDGSSIDVPSLKDSWDGLFCTKRVTWVRFASAQSTGPRPGLKEFEVYKTDQVIYQELGVVENTVADEAVIGRGVLYLNGRAIAQSDDLIHRSADENLQIGNDAYWWHQMAAKSGSLDGSVRDMVWFDRALTGKEVAQLRKATQPEVKPDVPDDRVIVLDGRPVGIGDIMSLPPFEQRTVLLLLGRKDEATLRKHAEQIVPVAEQALGEPGCRRVAANLLLKLNREASLQEALPRLVSVVKNASQGEPERADAILALAAMGKAATQAIPVLAETLDELVPGSDVQTPGVEELLRNALTRALLDIDFQNVQAREVVERTFAVPMMKAIDLDRPAVAKETGLLARMEQGAYLEAMEIYPRLHHSVREYFFTYKAPKDRDYTATARFNGATYKVGTGIAWQGVEKVPVDEYKAIAAELAREYPAAADWHKPEYEHLYRVPITKIDADGREQKIYLEGKRFILDGHDAKCRAWSIFVDELGYVHVMGGQHNAPNPDQYIPGSWEKMGVSRHKTSDDYPLQMYWVSTEPESIDSLKFAGQRSNPQAIPASYLNYLCFVQSPDNETYLYGRSEAFGWQCWGMFRYDAKARSWTAVGGDPYDLIESARRHNPDWLDYLHDPVRGSIPKAPSDSRPLVWAWQPPFYNFCRDGWGVRFDKTGRLHVRMQISGLDGAGYVRPTAVYAWSDDGGESFHRADGSEVKLPLTVNPAPEHNAELDVDNTLQHHAGGQFATRQWLGLWLELIKETGFRT